MSSFYANITLQSADIEELAAYLKSNGDVAYVAAGSKGTAVVFHEDLSAQERLAARLSAHFGCPALLVMAYGRGVLLYHLYEKGEQTDAYVSCPHDDLELRDPAPAGNAQLLCAAFGMERSERRVESILRKEGKPEQPYEYAINRHGELAQALGLPAFAAGTGFGAIEMGELPAGPGFDPGKLRRTP
ncbi:MAG TPA: hypothetical protein VFC78_14135 [Tepidisphaeraceae bacterium]|nr:hypothetical protein [Tepidisphaeraceae bacterium]